MGLRSRISELSLSWVSGQEDTDPACWREWAIGVDCHSKFLAICIIIPDFQAKTVRRIQKRVEANFASIRAAKTWIVEILHKAGHKSSPFSYCLESTGCYHIPVIHAWREEPCVINPCLAGSSKRKTDKLDAQTLARNHLSGLWGKTWFPSDDLLELRCLDRARRNARRTAHRYLLSISAHLLTYGYTFTAWNSLGHQEVRPHIEDLCEGKPILHEDARCHLSDVPIPEGVRAVIKEAYKTYDIWTEKANLLLKSLLAKIKQRSWPTGKGEIKGKDLMKLLITAPGVGEITAATWLIQIGDPARFTFPKQIAAYCGFDPSLKVSAGNVTANVRRKGNKLLHAAFVQCGQSVLRRSAEPLGWWGSTIARKGKGAWQRAVAAVGRRIVIGLWMCQIRQEPWTNQKYETLKQAVPPPKTPAKRRGEGKPASKPPADSSSEDLSVPGESVS